MDLGPPPRRGDPLIVAHRGAWAQAPQNSLAALETAIRLRCDMVEVDVRRTRDRKLVTIHDPRVGATLVSGLDYDELQDKLGPDHAPPRLEDFLDAAAAGAMRLDVELKEAGYEELIGSVLAARMPAGSYVVTSFVPAALAALRQTTPEVRTGLLLRPGPGARVPDRRFTESRADFVAPHARLARAGLLAWAAERGLDAYVWTVNSRRIIGALLADPRVTALITDRPAEALALRDELDPEAATPGPGPRPRRGNGPRRRTTRTRP